MKILATLALAATFAATAFAGDPTPRWMCAEQHAKKMERTYDSPTVAIYSGRGVGYRQMESSKPQLRSVQRQNAHGNTIVTLVPDTDRR